MNPASGEPFNHVLEMRAAKIRDLQNLTTLAENVAFVKYEFLIANNYANVAGWMLGLKEKHGLTLKNHNIEIPGKYFHGDSQKGKLDIKKHEEKQFYFNPQVRNSISTEVVRQINQNADWEAEALAGYQKIEV